MRREPRVKPDEFILVPSQNLHRLRPARRELLLLLENRLHPRGLQRGHIRGNIRRADRRLAVPRRRRLVAVPLEHIREPLPLVARVGVLGERLDQASVRVRHRRDAGSHAVRHRADHAAQGLVDHVHQIGWDAVVGGGGGGGGVDGGVRVAHGGRHRPSAGLALASASALGGNEAGAAKRVGEQIRRDVGRDARAPSGHLHAGHVVQTGLLYGRSHGEPAERLSAAARVEVHQRRRQETLRRGSCIDDSGVGGGGTGRSLRLLLPPHRLLVLSGEVAHELRRVGSRAVDVDARRQPREFHQQAPRAVQRHRRP